MYSLYRAWFGGGDACAPLGPLAPLETLSPPDTLIRVGNDGEHQFVAHRGVLAAHSGYLKALLATTSASNSNASASTASGTNDNAAAVTSLSVSSVGGEAFGPLLNYMYTGRLEVTLDNIYSVLLATHLLHMPGALEQCRAALLRLRAPPASSTGRVLRPVPNRVVGPPLCWPQPGLYPSGPVGLNPYPPLAINPPISALPSQLVHESLPNTYTTPDKSSSPQPSTSQTSRAATRSTSRSLISEAPPDDNALPRGPRTPSPSSSSERISVTDTEPPRRMLSISGDQRPPGSSPSVVIDIACCDGPVRFHRVLNANYVAPQGPRAPQAQRSCSEDTSPENDENGHPDGAPECYTCSYCRHSFKSQYCYQKHARRHLHPAEAEGSGAAGGRARREVRLLDLNVQYYPCKICGSKFPSYYFVHKHRKLCHANEDNQSGSDELNVANSSSSSNPQIP